MMYNGVNPRKLERIAENTRKLRSLLPVSSGQLEADFVLQNGTMGVPVVRVDQRRGGCPAADSGSW